MKFIFTLLIVLVFSNCTIINAFKIIKATQKERVEQTAFKTDVERAAFRHSATWTSKTLLNPFLIPLILLQKTTKNAKRHRKIGSVSRF